MHQVVSKYRGESISNKSATKAAVRRPMASAQRPTAASSGGAASYGGGGAGKIAPRSSECV